MRRAWLAVVLVLGCSSSDGDEGPCSTTVNDLYRLRPQRWRARAAGDATITSPSYRGSNTLVVDVVLPDRVITYRPSASGRVVETWRIEATSAIARSLAAPRLSTKTVAASCSTTKELASLTLQSSVVGASTPSPASYGDGRAVAYLVFDSVLAFGPTVDDCVTLERDGCPATPTEGATCTGSCWIPETGCTWTCTSGHFGAPSC